MKAKAVIVRNENQFNLIKAYLGEYVLYLNWVPAMETRETAIVVTPGARIKGFDVGSLGCAQYQRESGIVTVEFDEFFKDKRMPVLETPNNPTHETTKT